MLSMVLHELATNAAKYGALVQRHPAGSRSNGRNSADKRLRLTWKETGGPPAQPGERKGFGSLLIEEAFAAQVGGSASWNITADGVVCTLECPHL